MFKENLAAVIDLCFPKNCHVCRRLLKDRISAFDEHLCGECTQKLKKTSLWVCLLCAEDLHTPQEFLMRLCRRCRETPPAQQRLRSCYVYEEPARTLIHQLKYAGRAYLATSVAALMLEALTQLGDECLNQTDLLTFVPLHPARFREREFNQAELIAEALGRYTHKPVLSTLKRIRPTRPQASLSRQERLSNVRGVFQALSCDLIKDKNLVLIDDIVTTGATVAEASAALKKSGAGHIVVLTFTRD